MSIASWYAQQYSTWNRTRRLQQPQYLARTETNTSRAATAMAQSGQTATIAPNANNIAPANADSAAPNPNKEKKASDPLFGPNIGPCSAGPTWTNMASRKKLITDDLTPDVLNSWVEKSKQPTQPTTTLQALVNLKRPTLRLSPLSSVPEDAQSPLDPQHQHLHGLEFQYDCDAPKCGIYVHVVLPKSHPEAAAIPSASNQASILVFEFVTPGGFGKRLTLEEGALLELGRFDYVPHPSTSPDSSPDGLVKSESTADVATIPPTSGDASASSRPSRRRFTQHFHFRKRSHNRSVAGPALAVVDADPTPAQDAKKDKDKEDQEGVRVMIRLAALDEQGTELSSPNEQMTFLHIVRLGAQPTTPAGEDAEVEDSRPWVVKVVKREATIGPHTFQLHEIYGLTSSANSQSTPNGTDVHTYPPTAAADDDDPQSECLLCLSSPREVVLVPCRHLVACKECALNMVEFGAGGNITHAPEPTTNNPAEGTEATGEPTNGTEGGTTNTPAPTTPTIPPMNAARRKRKAKGWFCPVCRQPYTSLLRISTAAPPTPEKEAEGNGAEENQTRAPTDTTGDNRAAADPETTEGRPGGLLGNTFGRPGFLRGISFANRNGNAPLPPPPADVESQAGLGRPGA